MKTFPKTLAAMDMEKTSALNSKRSLKTRLFDSLFSHTLVYNQTWEDPLVDLSALQIDSRHRIVAIASAGCNLLTYLTANPELIAAVDINRHHLALARMKAMALRHLPSHSDFFDFFGIGSIPENIQLYHKYLRPNLDSEARIYWEARNVLGGRPIDRFSSGLYRSGLTSKFIGAIEAAGRMSGRNISSLLLAKTMREQRAIFDQEISPLFESRWVHLLAKSPVGLYPLGIPPSQYRELERLGVGNVLSVLRRRIERLACDFPIKSNYFAWQVFSRAYDTSRRLAIPMYLEAELYPAMKSRADRIVFYAGSLEDYLVSQPSKSIHRYVLLDSQDWMTPAQLVRLWEQIDRTADERDARVIFRTAGQESPLDQRVPNELHSSWEYLKDESQKLHLQDRSALYGGFHIYRRANKPA